MGKPKKLNIIYAGSTCIYTRTQKVVGIVINTSWNTFKGNLVGKLYHQKMETFKFDVDLKDYSLIMLVMFSFIAAFLFYLDVRDGQFSMSNTIVRLVEIFTCAIPPSLFFAFRLTSVIIGS